MSAQPFPAGGTPSPAQASARPQVLRQYIASLGFYAVIILALVPVALAVVASFVLPRERRYRVATLWTRLAIRAARDLCHIEVRVTGWENLPDGPAILLPKHQSAWETLWLTTAMPRPLTYVYKRELHWVPILGWGIAALGMIHVNRSRGSESFAQVVLQGARRLQEGWWIVIFPEATRTAPGANPQYKTGGARLAIRTGVPVVPIAIDSGECWPRQSIRKFPGTISVCIGPPLYPIDDDPVALTDRVQDWIETEMRRLAPHRYPQAPWRTDRAPALPASSYPRESDDIRQILPPS